MPVSRGIAANRVVIFAPDPHLRRWIEEELAGESLVVAVAHTAADIVRALVETPPPRPGILVVDLDAMSPSDVLRVHTIRDRGWAGSMIAVGEVAAELRTTLNVEHVLARPLGSEVLRKLVTEIGKATTKMPKLVGS